MNILSSNEKTHIKMLKAFLSLIPALLLMILIFGFSAQPAEESSELSLGVSLSLLETIRSFLHLQMDTGRLQMIAEQLETLVRKLAHFSEYAILGLTTVLPAWYFPLAFPPLRKFSLRRRLFFMMIICALYAASDELHQFFVPGRACRFLDICIDSAGAAAGLLLFFYLFSRYSARTSRT